MIKIVAKYNVAVNVDGKTVDIVKGDAFTLHGKVFAYKDVLVDFTSISNAFDIVKEPALSTVPTYELTANIALPANGKTIVLPAGLRFSSVSDIVYINGAILDVCKWKRCIRKVEIVDTPVESDDEIEDIVEEEPAVEKPAEDMPDTTPVTTPATDDDDDDTTTTKEKIELP
jgi:hypothetical protein